MAPVVVEPCGEGRAGALPGRHRRDHHRRARPPVGHARHAEGVHQRPLTPRRRFRQQLHTPAFVGGCSARRRARSVPSPPPPVRPRFLRCPRTDPGEPHPPGAFSRHHQRRLPRPRSTLLTRDGELRGPILTQFITCVGAADARLKPPPGDPAASAPHRYATVARARRCDSPRGTGRLTGPTGGACRGAGRGCRRPERWGSCCVGICVLLLSQPALGGRRNRRLLADQLRFVKRAKICRGARFDRLGGRFASRASRASWCLAPWTTALACDERTDKPFTLQNLALPGRGWRAAWTKWPGGGDLRVGRSRGSKLDFTLDHGRHQRSAPKADVNLPARAAGPGGDPGLRCWLLDFDLKKLLPDVTSFLDLPGCRCSPCRLPRCGTVRRRCGRRELGSTRWTAFRCPSPRRLASW